MKDKELVRYQYEMQRGLTLKEKRSLEIEVAELWLLERIKNE